MSWNRSYFQVTTTSRLLKGYITYYKDITTCNVYCVPQFNEKDLAV